MINVVEPIKTLRYNKTGKNKGFTENELRLVIKCNNSLI